MKREYKVALSVILILIVFLSIIGVHKFLNPQVKKEPIAIKILDTISQYDYSINDRASEFYKKEFSKLKEILEKEEIDYEDYSEQIAKMFIIDLYSINSKVNKYDVGGAQFFHSNRKAMHEDKVKNTLYDLVEDDSYGDRKQELPLVNDIKTISIKEIIYTMGETESEAYEVELSWTYEKDMDYDNKGKVIVVKEGIKEVVVSYQPIDEEKEGE